MEDENSATAFVAPAVMPASDSIGVNATAALSTSLLPHLAGEERPVVEVQAGTGKTIVCPAVLDTDHPGEEIGLDQRSRTTLEVTVGDKVEVSPVHLDMASRCSLLPPLEVPHDQVSVSRLETTLDEGPLPVADGMFIELPTGRNGGLVTFLVTEVSGGMGYLTGRTELEILPPDPMAFESLDSLLGLEEVGGLGRQTEEILDLVALPLWQPDLYSRMGIKPAKGVLLHGPPGTGKTLLCRALAKELGVAFLHVGAPEVIGGHHGETEKRLRLLFRKALDQAPCIIFIDELDAIAQSREDLSSQADQRAVAQLLALMDGLKQTQGVVVVGTTNRVDSIDEAFRRPGRFDAEIYLGPPDEDGRLDILRIHTRDMPLGEGVDAALVEVAAQTPGFTGADLAALCREAGMESIRRTMRADGTDVRAHFRRASKARTLGQQRIEREDFLGAQGRVTPSAGRVYQRSHGRHFGPERSYAEMDAAETSLRRLLKLRLGADNDALTPVVPPRGAILRSNDLAGAGQMVRRLVGQVGANLIEVHPTEFFSQWLGESEGRVRRLFTRAGRLQPTVILFEQLDVLTPRQEDGGGHHRLFSQLLTSLDNLKPFDRIFVVGLTERAEIDRRLTGPGRLEARVSLPEPGKESRQKLIGGALDGAYDDAVVTRLTEVTDGLSEGSIRSLSAVVHELMSEGTASTEEVISEIGRLFEDGQTSSSRS